MTKSIIITLILLFTITSCAMQRYPATITSTDVIVTITKNPLISPTDTYTPIAKPSLEPITLRVFPNIERKTLDELITESNLVVEGIILSDSSSRWNTENGLRPDTLTSKSIPSGVFIYTESSFSIQKIFKGDPSITKVIIIQLGGKVGQDTMINSVEPLLEKNQEYLLFLVEDTWAKNENTRVEYAIRGSIQGLFTIHEGNANSIDYQMDLRELEEYIFERIK